jgi:tetratricopeptide (TPR) repeat protein
MVIRCTAAAGLVSAALFVACGERGRTDDAEPAEERIALFQDLGTLHHPITTRDPDAQRYFDQGLRLAYAFNHAEAIRSFRAATELDPECAMCWWGIAFAYGPNINAPMDSSGGAAAYQAVQQAQQHASNATEKEQAFIAALIRRYGEEPKADRATLDSAYAAAMAELATRYADDDDALTLYADALMNLSPWNYWVGTTPRPGTQSILAALEQVLARNPDHPGTCHLFIHAVEAAFPDRAVACADRLPGLMPGAGHIVHMPAHIYVRVGRWADAITTNEHAIHADEQDIQDMAPDGIYRLGYYPHNYHFVWFAASMAGNSERAIRAARDVAARVDTSLMRSPELVALQHYLVTPLYALVRFGRWDEILAEPAPPRDLYPTGIWHYARALAYAAKDQPDAATAEVDALEKIAADPTLATLLIWNINSVQAVLQTAMHVAAGEVAARRGDLRGAIAHLRQGVATEDAMLLDEPPTWHLPVRHNLGAVLLQAGRAQESEAAYRQDLERFPANGWSLFGLAQSLRAQGRTRDADAALEQFRAAWTLGDVELTASRY